MIRLAFYGRVSTEDQQDPEASRNWQIARARALLVILREADSTGKAEVYRELGLKLIYDHETETITAEATPRSSACVVSVSEGGFGHYAHALNQRRRIPVARQAGDR
ncbi:hypothetical protein CcI156_21215 [Frankia sp. CcI156]|uniref:Resolvase/invertase-type recombinase catalytic domain-containing protein n=1 Tax=Frankia casuarinae (strain DSM 45818 / CECT 9043 / HFP020203 / CcI3) TaxID=106370 RepID=Q2JB41_FRACC|nr:MULTISPECIES: hypothetical protein [Frankia]ABD11501.1 hypothetical protein Francci3_2129 [Frankia casuarinae]ETA00133.1 hypothetical protein CcI6DRAFT_04466 [Frankia sp. CcI6]EYT90273.1 hypothetical protein ThrDRAFT_04083 [Frankia casuarinae]KDA41102.1 hypothetical protein BMG523Draft_04066 [Frankia sp. BMG5.23]KEZ34585.1 hypothetical protein CEDDRAFT_04048 [Frankia sp. CeD]